MPRLPILSIRIVQVISAPSIKLMKILQTRFHKTIPRLTAASNLNTNLIPADSMQLLQKQVNASFINYLINGFTFAPVDISSLKQIAPLCSVVYGNAVWEARSLILGIDNTQYFNPCEIITRPVTTSNRLMQNEVSEITNENKTASVYPNPNMGNFTIPITGKFTQLNVEVYNVLGAVVLNRQFILENATQLQIEGLNEGVYMVKISGDGLFLKTERVIVTK
jgi:hypothetical protein